MIFLDLFWSLDRLKLNKSRFITKYKPLLRYKLSFLKTLLVKRLLILMWLDSKSSFLLSKFRNFSYRQNWASTHLLIMETKMNILEAIFLFASAIFKPCILYMYILYMLYTPEWICRPTQACWVIMFGKQYCSLITCYINPLLLL